METEGTEVVVSTRDVQETMKGTLEIAVAETDQPPSPTVGLAVQPTNHSSSSSTCPPSPSRAVREALDRVLAVAAKGRTRWSRAILTNHLKRKVRRHKKQKRASAAGTGTGRLKKQKFNAFLLKGKVSSAVQRKFRVLGRLVPGCRKQPWPVILEEATDYAAALEMQVRAMSRLTQLLSVSGSTSGAGESTSAPPPS